MSNIEGALKRQITKNSEKLFGKKPVERLNNAQLLSDTGLRILHVNRVEDGDRSMTVAFKCDGSIVEFATAIVHPKDTFNRKLGTKTAVEAFTSGKTAKVPVGPMFKGNPAHFLRIMFEVI